MVRETHTLADLVDAAKVISATRKHTLVSPKQEHELRAQGYRPGVLHMHSTRSPDVPRVPRNTPSGIVARAARQGIKVLCISDHDSDQAYHDLRDHPTVANGDVLLSRSNEMTIDDPRRLGHKIHVGVHNIPSDDVAARLNDFAYNQRDLYGMTQYALDHGVTVVGVHPFWAPQGAHLDAAGWWTWAREFGLPVEINSKRPCAENLATLAHAGMYNLPLVAGTDSHISGFWPAVVYAQGTTLDEYFANLREGKGKVVAKSSNVCSVPWMVGRYLYDTIAAQGHPELYDGPVALDAGNVLVDPVVKWLSDGKFRNLPLMRDAVGAAVGGIVGSLSVLYLLGSNATSSVKVLQGLEDQADARKALELARIEALNARLDYGHHEYIDDRARAPVGSSSAEEFSGFDDISITTVHDPTASSRRRETYVPVDRPVTTSPSVFSGHAA